MVSTGSGVAGSISFAWENTRPQQAPVLADPGHQTSAEGDNISLQLMASDANGDWLTFAAAGLPAGLSLDAATGLISGQVSRFAAATGAGPYTVWVAVSDGNGHTATRSFPWTVTSANIAPWLGYPGTKVTAVGEPISDALQAGDYENDLLTFSATGLPPGVTLNPTTGVFVGAAQTAGEYTITATVSDGQDSASQTFLWRVLPGAAPRVIIAVNRTLDKRDDVALVNPSQPIPVEITLVNASPGWHQIEVSITPSIQSSLDLAQFYLTNGGTRTVWVTPVQRSQVEDDVTIDVKVDGQIPQKDRMTNAEVVIPEHIRAKNTPDGMPDRIPPRTKTEIEFEVLPKLAGKYIEANFGGRAYSNGAAANGDVVFLTGADDNVEAAALNLTGGGAGTYKLRIRGKDQTAPTADGKGGNAGNLYFVVAVGTKFGDQRNVRNSNGFSVAAIPVGVEMRNPKFMPTAVKEEKIPAGQPNAGAAAWVVTFGVVYEVTYHSDSEDAGDLDKVEISELIKVVDTSGAVASFWTKGSLDVSGFRQASQPREGDLHALALYIPKTQAPTALQAIALASAQIKNEIDTKGNGTGNQDQWFVYTEARTGMTNRQKPLLVPNSGFQYTLVLQKDGGYFMRISKSANANNGTDKGIISTDDSKPQLKEL